VVGNRRTDLADLQRPERAFPLSFSDISHAIEDLFSAEDKVVLRSTTSGQALGRASGYPSDGQDNQADKHSYLSISRRTDRGIVG
jgi:hypothetical protein